MNCPNCGKTIEDGSVFCGECGQRIADAQIPQTPVQTVAPETPKKRAKGANILFWIGFALACVGIVGFFLIILVGLIVYGRIYTFDGYASTRVFCWMSAGFMTAGSVMALAGWLAGLRRNSKALNVRNAVMSLALFFICLVLVIIIIYAYRGSRYYMTQQFYSIFD